MFRHSLPIWFRQEGLFFWAFLWSNEKQNFYYDFINEIESKPSLGTAGARTLWLLTWMGIKFRMLEQCRPGQRLLGVRLSACRGMATQRSNGWLWKEANLSTTGAGGGGKAGSAHPAAGWRGTAAPEPSPLPALQGQVAPRPGPGARWAPTVLPTPQHQNQWETLWFCAFNLLRPWQESPQSLRQRAKGYFMPQTLSAWGEKGQEWISRARHAGEWDRTWHSHCLPTARGLRHQEW